MTKDYPLEPECNANIPGGTPIACEAAAAVRMARDKGKGEALEDWLFANQQTLSALVVCKTAVRNIGGVADFDARYPRVLEQVKADTALGGFLGVRVDARPSSSTASRSTAHPAPVLDAIIASEHRARRAEIQAARRSACRNPDRGRCRADLHRRCISMSSETPRTLAKDYSVGFWRPRPYRALDGLTLDVEPGEVFGFLGPNGAGKTTTLKLLMQLVYPTSGTRHDPGPAGRRPRMKRRIGYLPENPYFYDYLTAEELLGYFAGLFGYRGADRRQRVARLLDEVGLGAERRLQLRKFSKGMMQRVGLAQALINDPEVVFLDEPMSGLDPLGRRDIRALILRLRDEGRTVFFSSHILSDAETLCSRVAIVAGGRLVASGRSPTSSRAQPGWEIVVEGCAGAAVAALGIRASSAVHARIARRIATPSTCRSTRTAAGAAGAARRRRAARSRSTRCARRSKTSSSARSTGSGRDASRRRSPRRR